MNTLIIATLIALAVPFLIAWPLRRAKVAIPTRTRNWILASYYLCVTLTTLVSAWSYRALNSMSVPYVDGFVLLGLTKLVLALGLFCVATTLSALTTSGVTLRYLPNIALTAKWMSWVFLGSALVCFTLSVVL